MTEKTPLTSHLMAMKYWSAIQERIESDFESKNVPSQKELAEDIWLKAFEAGYVKGLEALSEKPEPAQPEMVMRCLQEQLGNRRHVLIDTMALALIRRMLVLIPPEARLSLNGSITAPVKLKPELKLVTGSEIVP